MTVSKTKNSTTDFFNHNITNISKMTGKYLLFYVLYHAKKKVMQTLNFR